MAGRAARARRGRNVLTVNAVGRPGAGEGVPGDVHPVPRTSTAPIQCRRPPVTWAVPLPSRRQVAGLRPARSSVGVRMGSDGVFRGVGLERGTEVWARRNATVC